MWLDRKQTRAEAARVRSVHKLADFLRDLEAGRPGARPITKYMAQKSVLIGGQRVAFMAGTTVKWTQAGAARVGAHDRELATAFAESA